MASEAWLESSLCRSSKLGQEVLEKAKRRSVNWRSTRPGSPLHMFSQNSDLSHSSLDHAFATIVEYMAETTRQCKKFHTAVHLTESREREHVCRYHSQQTSRTADQEPITRASIKRDIEPEDFAIEVSPGTYSITAAMQDSKPHTKTVRINAGESMSLTFNL
ncbi:A-kinase-interacting protein 1 [Xyrauchen texanus]|uniref:A-kinase-interacting protein 1 n=1 Tax=Xyrauchen texanus TaxID=154827 RepID=UPI002241CC80|nr:A-kinase-interacting protein 1 [Xyrauchen texanus]